MSRFFSNILLHDSVVCWATLYFYVDYEVNDVAVLKLNCAQLGEQ
jgi:hypothetical protein